MSRPGPVARAPDTLSGRRIGAWYFIAQGLAITAWWTWLTVAPSARALFVPPGASDADLLAFRLPDLLVAVPTSLIAGAGLLVGSRWAIPLAWAATGTIVYAFAYCSAWAVLRQGGWLSVALMAPAALLSTVSALDASGSMLRIFRRARAVSPGRHVVTTLGQIVVFWSFFLFVVPAAIAYVDARLPWGALGFAPRRAAAACLFAAFSGLGLWSGMTMAARGAGTPLPFASPNRLVTSGPYAYVRNPMVIAGLGQGAAVGLWLGSWAVLGYVAAGGLIWDVLVRPAEERDLREMFGDGFTDYCRRVRCWIPRL